MSSIRTLVLALPLIELALLIVLGSLIGAGPTFLIILGTGVVGMLLMSAARRAQMPGQPGLAGMGRYVQGGAASIGGLLLVIPGVLTDLLGLVLLIPGPRRWIMKKLQRYMFKRFTGLDIDQMPKPEDLQGFGGFGPDGPGSPPDADAPPLIVDAEVTSVRDDPS